MMYMCIYIMCICIILDTKDFSRELCELYKNTEDILYSIKYHNWKR